MVQLGKDERSYNLSLQSTAFQKLAIFNLSQNVEGLGCNFVIVYLYRISDLPNASQTVFYVFLTRNFLRVIALLQGNGVLTASRNERAVAIGRDEGTSFLCNSTRVGVNATLI